MKIESLKLVKPTAQYKQTFLEGLIEFQQEKLAWIMDLNTDDLKNDFQKFVDGELTKKTLWTAPPYVDETELWAILGETYVGRVSIRHELNDTLRIMGGHIGYDTRPSFRGRGIASLMLKIALTIAYGMGITEALITCNDDNLPSIRVIEKNGGVLKEIKLQSPNGPLKRYYWIPCTPP
jgi:predicted acetyltransferase